MGVCHSAAAGDGAVDRTTKIEAELKADRDGKGQRIKLLLLGQRHREKYILEDASEGNVDNLTDGANCAYSLCAPVPGSGECGKWSVLATFARARSSIRCDDL